MLEKISNFSALSVCRVLINIQHLFPTKDAKVCLDYPDLWYIGNHSEPTSASYLMIKSQVYPLDYQTQEEN
jgi:hypothetical protein